MDCIEAQGLISAGMDREPVSAASLAEAKEHCRTCPNCSAFVRAQLASTRVTLPEAPADLADRVMARVRAEAEQLAAERDAAEALAAEAQAHAAAAGDADLAENRAAPEETPSPDAVPAFLTPTLAPKPRRESRLPRTWVTAVAAAAMLVALLGVGAVITFGVRLMSSSPAQTHRTYTVDLKSPDAAPQAEQQPLRDGNAAATGGSGGAGPNAITVNGTVYLRGTTSNTSTGTLTIVGTASSSLDSGQATKARSVYGRPGTPGTVYVTDDSDALWEFARVTREYQGTTYVLKSGDLSRYGLWPTLPAGMQTPTGENGEPTFVTGGVDATGARVYVLSSQSGSGIALAPGTAGGELANDPNWSWWAAE